MLHTYLANMDLAATYALRRPKIAAECLWLAFRTAVHLGRPDLAYRANELLGVIYA